MPTRPFRLALGASLGLALGACADVASTVPPRPAPPDAATANAAYPEPVDVPGRPKLTYTLEQRRSIEDRLVADRDNARHAADALRAGETVPPLPRDLGNDAAGQAPPADPPPPAPPPAAGTAVPVVPDVVAALQDTAAGELKAAAAAASVAAAGGDGAAVPAPALPGPVAAPAASPGTAITAQSEAVGDRVRDDLDTIDAEGTLSDFLDTLERGQARRFEREGVLARDARTPVQANPAPAAKNAAPPAALAERLATAPASVDLPSAGPVRLPFAPGAARPDQAGLALLDRLGATLAAGAATGKVTLVADGPAPAVALDRARAVAVRLVRAGLPAGRIEMKLGGAGDAVTIYRPDADA